MEAGACFLSFEMKGYECNIQKKLRLQKTNKKTLMQNGKNYIIGFDCDIFFFILNFSFEFNNCKKRKFISWTFCRFPRFVWSVFCFFLTFWYKIFKTLQYRKNIILHGKVIDKDRLRIRLHFSTYQISRV